MTDIPSIAVRTCCERISDVIESAATEFCIGRELLLARTLRKIIFLAIDKNDDGEKFADELRKTINFAVGYRRQRLAQNAAFAPDRGPARSSARRKLWNAPPPPRSAGLGPPR